jgi:hypothetical protein
VGFCVECIPGAAADAGASCPRGMNCRGGMCQ